MNPLYLKNNIYRPTIHYEATKHSFLIHTNKPIENILNYLSINV